MGLECCRNQPNCRDGNPPVQTMSSDKNSNELPPGDQPVGIEYVGVAGISKECQDAVLRLIQFGTRITHVRILSAKRRHCLLLTLEGGDQVAVKSGFATGYRGEGPSSLLVRVANTR